MVVRVHRYRQALDLPESSPVIPVDPLFPTKREEIGSGSPVTAPLLPRYCPVTYWVGWVGKVGLDRPHAADK